MGLFRRRKTAEDFGAYLFHTATRIAFEGEESIHEQLQALGPVQESLRYHLECLLFAMFPLARIAARELDEEIGLRVADSMIDAFAERTRQLYVKMGKEPLAKSDLHEAAKKRFEQYVALDPFAAPEAHVRSAAFDFSSTAYRNITGERDFDPAAAGTLALIYKSAMQTMPEAIRRVGSVY